MRVGGAFVIVGLLMAGTSTASAESYPAVPGSLGAIPDSPSAICGATPGGAREVIFEVSGLTVAPTDVQVSFTLAPAHQYLGDLFVELISPIGERHTILGRTGAITADGCGDSSNMAGPYTFSDLATGSWWQAAAAAGQADAVPGGAYRSTSTGGAGATDPMPPTSITAAFPGTANRTGEWMLRFIDWGAPNAASVSAATLDISTTPRTVPAPPAPPPGRPGRPPVAPDHDRPQTKIKKRPANRTDKRKVTFRFSSDERGASFACSVNGSRFKRCRSPKTVRARRGKNTFRVRARDLAGNVDRTPARDTWRWTGG
jgi:hypothetical protein